MIIDKISEAEKYYGVFPAFKAAFECLKGLTADSEDRRYEIDGDRVFVNLSSYVNKPEGECKFESHAKYADIQFVVTGHEYIDVCPAEGLAFTENRLEDGDIAFYTDPASFTRADLTPGTFVVLFPGEAHRPLVAPDGKGVETKKAVAKVLVIHNS